MRILVCGGRDYNKHVRVYDSLDSIRDENNITTIIEGGATGADNWAASWARMNHRHVEHLQFKADWENYGRAAGPMRNAQMLREGKPDLVVAFTGGAGTRNMVKLAKAAGIKVLEIT